MTVFDTFYLTIKNMLIFKFRNNNKHCSNVYIIMHIIVPDPCNKNIEDFY